MPKIYVACLAAYNDGILHGRWIDALQDPDDMQAEINEMLKESPIAGAEEFAVHGQEEFGGIRIPEFAQMEDVHQLAKACDKWPSAVVEHFYQQGEAFEDLDKRIEECLIGSVDDEYGNDEDALARYILDQEDWFWDELPERYKSHSRAIAHSEARDRLYGGDVYALYNGGGVWHFINNNA